MNMEHYEMVATTLFGFEETLADELKVIGAQKIEILNRAVRFEGDKKMMYKSNLYLRTALRVLMPISQFMIRDERDLYKKIQRIEWDKYLSVDGTLAIEATVKSDYFTHSKFMALKAKDAVVDQFRDKYSRRPSIDVDTPDLRINLHINDRNCAVSLDSSGYTLGKRGYRTAQSEAPMSEVLAAGIIALSQWDKKRNLVDPMCGSGTFSIEAAMIASNTPAGFFRNFGFEMWPDFDKTLWKQIKTEAREQIKKPEGKIFASDIDERSVTIAEQNAINANLAQFISFKKLDFLNSETKQNNCIVFLNPPYGERLKDEEEIIPFYKEIGTQLKHFYEESEAWIISANINALKFIGLRPSRKIKLFNGPLECKLQKYELFKGKKREQHQD